MPMFTKAGQSDISFNIIKGDPSSVTDAIYRFTVDVSKGADIGIKDGIIAMLVATVAVWSCHTPDGRDRDELRDGLEEAFRIFDEDYELDPVS
jgi:hypothetical protein